VKGERETGIHHSNELSSPPFKRNAKIISYNCVLQLFPLLSARLEGKQGKIKETQGKTQGKMRNWAVILPFIRQITPLVKLRCGNKGQKACFHT